MPLVHAMVLLLAAVLLRWSCTENMRGVSGRVHYLRSRVILKSGAVGVGCFRSRKLSKKDSTSH